MVDIGLLLFLILLGGVGFNLLRRPDAGPVAYWAWGGFALLGSGVCLYLVEATSPWVGPLGYGLGTLYSVLMLVGAMVFAGRARPRGAITAGFAIGVGRGVLEQNGYALGAHALGFAVEPTATAVAVVYAFRATRDAPWSSWQRALAPSLALMALLDLGSAVWLFTAATPLPAPLLGAWILGASFTLAVQIAAVSDRTRASLLRARDALEERVQARTAELARSVAVLEEQIAERRAAEAALRESEERYRILSELGSDYAFALRMDRDRHVEYEWASGGLVRITGYEARDLDGHGWLKLIHPEDMARAITQLEDALEGRTRELETRIVTRQGEVRWVHVLFQTSARIGTDGVGRFVGAVRDITERKWAERERRRLDQHMSEVQRLDSLGVLAGGIAHDFNNMLAVIRGNTRLALADLDAGLAPRERLERIQSAAQHATGLTEQMLTYSGRAPVSLRPLALSQLVLGTRDLLVAAMQEGTRLEFDLGEDLPAVEGDVTRLQQVLVNLVSNASEALRDEGGTIRVATGVCRVARRELSEGFGTRDAAPGDYVFLAVSDTGPGIGPEAQRRIFEPFFTTRASGRGLGLAAVLGIVVAHRGVIRIESRKGRGTTFRVLLPRTARPVETVADSPRREPRAAPSGSILVVDDDEPVLELAREFLERAGFAVLTAPGGQAGIDRFRAHRGEIDAVVLDLVMPGVGGAEAFLQMLRIRPEIPVVVTSGYDKEMVVQRFAGRGLAGFVYKPYEPEELVEAVRKAVTRDPAPSGA